MTFAEREESLEDGAPQRLYKFVYGAAPGASYRYTDAVEAIPYDDGSGEGEEDYDPIAIIRDAIRSNGTLENVTLSVEVPADAEIAQLFLVWPPSQPVALTIRAGHAGEAEFPVEWAGRVIGCQWGEATATLSCQPVSTSMARPGLRRRYALACQYVLYDAATCKASEAAATAATTASSVTGSLIGVPGGWSGGAEPAKYNGGKLSWTNADTGLPEVRRILAATAGTIRVAGLVRGLEEDQAIDATLGCNRQESDCALLHDNLVNFGGFPWLPVDNPVTANKYY